MYDMIAELIGSGGYDLADVLLKIDHFWLSGAIDASQRDALAAMARENAAPEGSYAPDGERILALESAVRDLMGRVAALEAAKAGDGGDPEPEPADEWPEWRQPTGALDCYAKGDRVTFNGRRYVSLMDGNVWSPAAYPAGWEEE